MNKTFEFNVTGMACASCQHNLQKAVGKIRGVHNVNVNLVSGLMTLTCDENFDLNIITDKVKSIGYGATLRITTDTDSSVSNRPAGI